MVSIICKQWQFSFFSILDSIFFSLSSLIAITRTYKAMLNKSGKNVYSCIVIDRSRNAFNFSPLRMTFSLVLSCVVCHFSHAQLFVILWTTACQAPLSMGFSRQEYGVGCMPSFKGYFQLRDQTHVSCISCTGMWILYHQHHLGSLYIT